MLEGKKILVTGGAGFIGSNLCHFLVKDNEVRCVDNLITGKKENISELLDNPRFQFLEMDIRNFEDCQRALKGIDVIFHQAALGSVPRSIKTPLNTNDHNITGFLNVLEAARQEEVQRFVFASSSSVYGDHETLPKKEEVIGSPLSPYAVTKHVNELYAEVYSRLYGLETVGLRYFNVFGPRQDPNGSYAAVIPRFIKHLKHNEGITINGDGNQTRDFTFIENVIQANVLAATVTNKEALNTIYNIAYGESISLNELVEKIRDGFDHCGIGMTDFEITYGDKRVGDIEHSFATVEKAQNLLGYQPTYSLEDGIKEYLEYLKETDS